MILALGQAAPKSDLKKKTRSWVYRGLDWVKTHPSDIIFYLGLLFLFLFQVAYVRRGGANVPYMDKLKITEYREVYFNGSSWGQVYSSTPGGLHWSPLGFFIGYIEYFLFHSNYIRIMYFQCVVFALISLLLYLNFKDTVPKAWRCLFLLPTLQVFTFTKWEITLYADLAFIFRILLFTIAVLLLNQFLMEPKNTFNQFLLLSVPVLLFLAGGAYGPAMAASISIVLLLHGIITKPLSKILLYYGLFVLVMAITYVIRAVIMPPPPASGSIGGEVAIGNSFVYIFTHLGQAFSFFFLNLASSIFGNSYMEANSLVDGSGILLGTGVFLAYTLAIVLFFMKKTYQRTWVPLIWIGYSLFCICLFMLARINADTGHWVASRYVYETCFGMLGILWVCIDAIAHRKTTAKRRIWGRPVQWVAGAVAAYLLIGFGISTLTEWRIAPYRQENMAQIQLILTYPEMYEEDDFAICQAPMDAVLRAREFYKNHSLSFFRTVPPDYSIFHIEYNQQVNMSQPELQNMLPVKGNLGESEGNGRRIIGSALSLYFTGEAVQNDLLLELAVEPYLGDGQLAGQTMQVYLNDAPVSEYYVTEPETLPISLPVEHLIFGAENDLNKITFVFPDAVSPQALGINEDVRLLSFWLSSLEIKTG